MDDWWFLVPTVAWCGWVFVVGLGVGSFLNVVVARLPYQKSIVWPNSRCIVINIPRPPHYWLTASIKLCS